jgi:CheY-like chemotaxis protein
LSGAWRDSGGEALRGTYNTLGLYQRPSVSETDASADSGPRDTASPQNEPILVVDDEAETRVELRAALESEGHAVIEASNGQEALRLLTGSPSLEPSLIVLDLKMPVMTGWEFLAIVHNYHRLARIPVLVITGRLADMAKLGSGPGCPDYLSKPLRADTFLEKVARLVGK